MLIFFCPFDEEMMLQSHCYDFFFNSQVDPPSEWSSNTKEINDDEILPTCVTQITEKLSLGCFDVSVGESNQINYKEFKRLAEINTIEFANIENAEDTFWDNIRNDRLYAVNNPFSLFGDETMVWNLDQFTRDDSCIHSKPSHRLLKVSVFHEQ